jgi:hypothetical protein
MTLKEKITKDVLDMPLINSPTKKEISDYEKGISNLEQIADEFAIGFAEWSIQWRVEFVDDTQEGVLYTYGGLYQKFTMKQLLEIYKKEKGL